jgi:tetratricopeptide (TPR) repeat protein
LRTTIISVFLFALCCGLYWGSLDNPFVNWDDYSLITQNEYIQSISWSNLKAIFTPGVVGAYQPIRNISYAIDHALWGQDTVGYHITNIVFYGLTAVVLFLLLSHYLGWFWAAAAGALIFAVHPIHVEPVAWLSGRKDALAGFFFLLSVLYYAKLDKAGMTPREWRVRYAVSLIAFLLSVFSKPTAVVLPALLVLHDLTFPKGAGLRLALRRWKRYLPFIAVAAAMTAITIYVGVKGDVVKTPHGGNFYSQFLTMLIVIVKNIRLLFVPVDLSTRYVDYYATSIKDFEVVVSVIFAFLLLLFTALMWGRSRVVAFGILWFGVTLSPVLNIVPISTLVADRYLYLPSVGYALLAGLAFLAVARRVKVAGMILLSVVTIAVGAAYSYQTVNRTKVWSNNIELWGNVVRQNPSNVYGHYAFANVYLEERMYEEAGNEYRKTIRLAPEFPSAWIGLGNTYFMRDSLDTAIRVYEEALKYCTSEQGELLVNMGHAFRVMGEHDKAIRTFRDAMLLDSVEQSARLGLAKSYVEAGDFDAAVAQYDELIEREPEEELAVVYHNMGLAYSYKGDYEKAVEYLRESLNRSPAFAEARFALANCYKHTGEWDEAAAHLRQILAGNPLDYRVLNNLWGVYTAMGMTEQALSALEEAARIAPDDMTIKNNLGATYVEMGRLDRAESMLSDVLEKKPDSAPAILNMGCVMAARGRHDEAMVRWREVLKLIPDSPEAHYNLACSQTHLGLKAEAVASLRRAYELGMSNRDLLLEDPDLEGLRGEPAFDELVRALHEEKAD